jgi:hypothetical protein
VTLATFIVAMLVSLKSPSFGFALICCALLVYLRPQPLGTGNERTKKVAANGAVLAQGAQEAGANCGSEISGDF